MIKTINGQMLRSMIINAAKLLDINRASIDALNVFPVPDGDTGTNMSLTIQSAVKELVSCKSNSVHDVLEAVAKGALRGARGNSGVILSQVLRGFCNTLKDETAIDTKLFANALANGSKVAYGAVSKPKEGTMLTVSRMVGEYAQDIRSKNKDFETFLTEIVKKGEEAVEITPSLLPVLKKAGVVDAGGKGLVCLYEGMRKAVFGEEIEDGNIDVTNEIQKTESAMEHAEIMNLGVIEFAYCTEFFIINIKKKTTLADIERLREKLMTLGDCVIVIGDLELVKVHVHTNKPGVALSSALELGELDKVKIENMLEQNRILKKKYEAEKKEMAMLAVSAGEGLSAIFKDLSVDGVIEGGQSMNPSASEIADAAMRINADNIFVFPNNKNIILAAEQAKSLVENKVLHVIPTKNIPQGFSAAIAFNPEISVEENKTNMIHSLDNVTAGQITYAVKDAKTDGFDLKKGDIIGLDNKKILAKGTNKEEVCKQMIEKLKNGATQVITLYYGEGVTEDEANALCDELANKYPDCDVQAMNGGQPIYYYYIALE